MQLPEAGSGARLETRSLKRVPGRKRTAHGARLHRLTGCEVKAGAWSGSLFGARVPKPVTEMVSPEATARTMASSTASTATVAAWWPPVFSATALMR
ncbi:hypothetical protein SAMN04490356_0284 [Streptomyces melanosporofaciens]|uniref:Uncharacterized protein n=1 Tax=Streptomyces melanosporofaciens TaxID=67327 RepID=A0A1H4I9H8_STRMJ|nr:hypothetical protein SAMN04490356_0284 [Streptomyces melanosporofaciens]